MQQTPAEAPEKALGENRQERDMFTSDLRRNNTHSLAASADQLGCSRLWSAL